MLGMVRPDLAAPPGVPVAEPAGMEQDHPAGGEPADRSLAWVLGAASPPAVLLFLWLGHGAMDRPDPQTGVAGTFYALGVAAAAVACWFMLRRHAVRWPLIVAAVAAFPLGLWVAYLAGGYGLAVFWTYHYFLYTVVPLWVLAVVAATVTHHTAGPEAGRHAIVAGGAGLTGALGIAMLVHLATLEDQAQAARDAHDIPGLAWLVVVAVLVAAARRRR